MLSISFDFSQNIGNRKLHYELEVSLNVSSFVSLSHSNRNIK